MSSQPPTFIESQPTLESCWRAIILFGRNVASYKFALGQALLELADTGKTFISLEELAESFAPKVTKHLKIADKQATSPNSTFLDACRQYNREEITKDELRDITVRRGFVNVIDAFHVVSQADVPRRFFIDERRHNNGIRLTDDLGLLRQSVQFGSLPSEVEARWRLVETAWSLGISPQHLEIQTDHDLETLFVDTADRRRISLTSVRDALNGYQKGRCFYCFRDIAIVRGIGNLADVDHFFPWSLGQAIEFHRINLDGIWNLVLACNDCNRGPNGKSDRVPAVTSLDRLHARNNRLIDSHHPLRETLMNQTGKFEEQRRIFLQQVDQAAINLLPHRWHAAHQLGSVF